MTSTLGTAQAIPSPASHGDPERTGLTAGDLRDGVSEHLCFTLGRSATSATPHDLYLALSHAVRDRVMARHLATREVLRQQRAKAVACLSAEFLIGPQRANNLLMLGIGPKRRRRWATSALPVWIHSSPSRRSPGSATVASDGWRPVSSSRWPSWRFRPRAMAAATSSASSSRPSATAGRSKPPTDGSRAAGPGSWVALANPPLNALLCECLGPAWPAQADRWSELERFAADAAFLERWGGCRLEAKRRLAQRIAADSQLVVDPLHLFDVQVKRVHEYKRQHLNALQVITRYLRIKAGDTAGMAPRTVLFGGKAAPGYFMARLIIRFIHGIAEVVNSDPDCRGLLQVVFLPDYNVKLSELVYPAADLSEQISTAGFEASGTGNMKLAMNGALTIGTLDGANVEIRERVGDADFFLFGHTAEQIAHLLPGCRPWEWLDGEPLLREAIHLVEMGHFSQGDRNPFRPLVENMVGRDPSAVIADFGAYREAQAAVDAGWADPTGWLRRSRLSTARSGFFSSDRAIRTDVETIRQVSACPVTITCPLHS